MVSAKRQYSPLKPVRKETKVVICGQVCYPQAMTNLVPHRHHPDLFIADLMTAPLKELAEHLEFPFFGLAPQPFHSVRRFEDEHGNYIELTPGHYGLPTIQDQDILIFCMTKAMDEIRRGRPVPGAGANVGIGTAAVCQPHNRRTPVQTRWKRPSTG